MSKTAVDTPIEHARIRAITATDAVTEALKATVPAIHRAACDGRVFKIPTQNISDELPPTAPVMALAGEEGVTQGSAALRALEYSEYQHPMATVRCPGVIQVEYDMGEAIAAVNEAKRELRAAMSAFGRSGWTVWRGRIPAWQRLNRLQAYRQWHWLDAPVRKIGFSWAGHTHSVEQIRIAELRRRLSRQDKERGHPHIELELARLAGFDPDEVVVIRKPIAPTPIANVAYADGRRCVLKTALPLITDNDMPKIAALPDFDPAKQASIRDDQTIDSSLVAYWHAWRYQAPYRFCLPADPVNARLECDQGELSVRVRQGIVACLRAADPRRLADAALAAVEAHGPVPGTPGIDDAGTIRVVAANRANAYLVSSDDHVWRVSIGDLSLVGQCP